MINGKGIVIYYMNRLYNFYTITFIIIKSPKSLYHDSIFYLTHLSIPFIPPLHWRIKSCREQLIMINFSTFFSTSFLWFYVYFFFFMFHNPDILTFIMSLCWQIFQFLYTLIHTSDSKSKVFFMLSIFLTSTF